MNSKIKSCERVLGNAIYSFGTTFLGLYAAGMSDPVGVALIPALITAVITLGSELKNDGAPAKKRKGLVSHLLFF